jgi:hypothetical protein
MKKEELLNIEFDGQSDLVAGLCEFFDFKKADNSEIEIWPYKSKLSVSIENLIGKELYNKESFIGIVEDCYFGKGPRGHSAVLIKCGNQDYSLTESKVKMYNKFSDKDELIDLHPSRKGIKFWSNGHILSEKDYKSLYYKTKEYRNQYEKSLNENLGTTGLKAPIQYKKIKDKISKTMDDRYGVSWFLERGCHYSAVTMTMQDKFGVDNLFYSDEWQIKNSRELSFGISKIEQEVVNYIVCFLKEYYPKESKYSMYYGVDVNQASIQDLKRKRTYRVDFLNDKLKVIIDFNGNYWHCNPEMFESEYYHQHKKMLAKDILEQDRIRVESLERIIGFRHLTIWELDWNKKREETKEIIKKFINEKK